MKRQEKTKKNNPKHKPKTGSASGSTVVGVGECRTRAATGDLLYSRNLLEDPRTTKEPLDVPWKISRDPHALAQGVTLGHALSVKNRHGRGWRLLDRKTPVTAVERRMSSKIQPK